MSALEGTSDSSPSGGRHAGLAAAAGAGAGYMAGRGRDDNSSSDFGSSPGSDGRTGMGVLRPPPTRRHGSLSSSSVLAGEDPQSPTSAGGMSSPQGMASQQSEQLPFFKDYYSSDDIHPGDRVAVLWAYQPRANDEFSLERGDMLKVVGIWDDGWATGVMMDERADEWDARRQAQRDSGVSSTSARGRDTSPPVSGEIKAFPLLSVSILVVRPVAHGSLLPIELTALSLYPDCASEVVLGDEQREVKRIEFLKVLSIFIRYWLHAILIYLNDLIDDKANGQQAARAEDRLRRTTSAFVFPRGQNPERPAPT
ncbi:hypothetical protein HYQ46_004251 [Verticillium longisporum]|nr:hypothetical protein HYQ46_004251 [Verticillium longisporum]